MQLIFKPLLSETDEVNRCERFFLTPRARTFQNKEIIHFNTMNCRAKVTLIVGSGYPKIMF